MTPGVRPSWGRSGRSGTGGDTGDAIAAGATYLVVGRPIMEAADPAKATAEIVAEMEAVYSNVVSRR